MFKMDFGLNSCRQKRKNYSCVTNRTNIYLNYFQNNWLNFAFKQFTKNVWYKKYKKCTKM